MRQSVILEILDLCELEASLVAAHEEETEEGIPLTEEELKQIEALKLPEEQVYLLFKPLETLTESIESKLAMLDDLPDFI